MGANVDFTPSSDYQVFSGTSNGEYQYFYFRKPSRFMYFLISGLWTGLCGFRTLDGEFKDDIVITRPFMDVIPLCADALRIKIPAGNDFFIEVYF